MRETITISIPQDLRKELDQITAEEGISRSDIVRESLRDYLFIRHYRLLRMRMMARAQAQGVYTDEDVFDRTS
jgi:metal-responsive CopG/Arc/MetJ family transcriptional regulator